MSQTEVTPQRRAAEAAEALSADGAPVTARAVRERSGVRMGVAADAAREWNQRQVAQMEVPALPEALQMRFEAAWRVAVELARGEFDEARAGWQQRVDEATEEQNVLSQELDRVETERDQLRADIDAARAEAEARERQSAKAHAEERSRADKAEGRAETIASERDRLVAERDTLLVRLEDLKDEFRTATPNPPVA